MPLPRFSLLVSHPGHSDAVTVVLHLAPELRDGTMGTFVPVATVAVPAEGPGGGLHQRP